MTRTLPEKMKWIESRIHKSSAFIADAIPKKDFEQIQLSGSLLVNHQIKLGLLLWRQKKDPTPYFKAAVSSVELVSSHLSAIDPEIHPTDLLPVTNVIYAAFLTGLQFDSLDLDKLDGNLVARAFFGNVLIRAANITDWPKHREALPQGNRYDLARRSNELYADLLAGRISPEKGVPLAETLWEERENDDYFMDGGEGAGNENLQIVDYQLGAILKKIGSTVPSVHAWIW